MVNLRNDRQAFLTEYTETVGLPKEKLFLDSLKMERRVSIHAAHEFFGKLIPAIPAWAIRTYTQPGDTVLDPFCGSGTVLVEARILGRNSYGIDIDPLACFITKVKTTPLDLTKSQLQQESEQLTIRIIKDMGKIIAPIPKFPNIDHWFEPDVQRMLALLREYIVRIENPDLRDFFLLCFSSVVRTVSTSDPRQLFPERTKHYEKIRQKHDVLDTFKKVTNDNIVRIVEFSNECKKTNANVFAKVVNFIEGKQDAEARDTKLDDESIHLVVTNPPYVSAVDYIRALRLNRYWLGLVENDIELRPKAIGMPTERKPTERPSRIGIGYVDELLDGFYLNDDVGAYITHRYFKDMEFSLKEMFRVLKPSGHVCIKIGAVRFKHVQIPLHEILVDLGKKVGFEAVILFPDEYRTGRSLLTKRAKHSAMIPHDWILVLRKPV